MPKEKPISKENMGTRLFSKDEAYIKKMVRKNGSTDKRFENNSATIRYYVGLGIKAENNAVEASKEFAEAIFINEQKYVVAEQLSPIVKGFNKLCDRIEAIDVNLADYFTNVEQKFADFESHFGRQTKPDEEHVGAAPESFVEQFSVSDKTSDATLLNLIVLRIALHVFVLKVKAGKTEPGKHVSAELINVIVSAQKHIKLIPTNKIRTLSNDVLETHVVKKMAIDIFAELGFQSKTKNE